MKMHIYLASINHKNMTQQDEKSVIILKSLVTKIVLERKEGVIDPYQVIRAHEKRDKHLHKWIKAGLKNL